MSFISVKCKIVERLKREGINIQLLTFKIKLCSTILALQNECFVLREDLNSFLLMLGTLSFKHFNSHTQRFQPVGSSLSKRR